MTPDEIIEVYAGQKAGRIWQVNSGAAHGGIWITPGDQSLANLRSIGNVPIRLAPLPDEITLPARVIPAPLREAPKPGVMTYFVSAAHPSFVQCAPWNDDLSWHVIFLERGLAYRNAHDAAKASIGMCPYA